MTGEIQILGLLPNASNAALLVRCGDEDTGCLAVYKPRRGERPLWDFPDGTLHRREVAASVLSGALGWPNVPPTVLRDGPEGPGSVQLFVRFDPSQHYFTLHEAHTDEFRLVALFDLVANNADRKGGHCLLGDDGTIWSIDHGVCFAAEPKLRTVIWDFVGEPFPPGADDDLARLENELDGSLLAALAPLLADDEIAALRQRIAALRASGTYPEPDPDVRPFPWPPI